MVGVLDKGCKRKEKNSFLKQRGREMRPRVCIVRSTKLCKQTFRTVLSSFNLKYLIYTYSNEECALMPLFRAEN